MLQGSPKWGEEAHEKMKQIDMFFERGKITLELGTDGVAEIPIPPAPLLRPCSDPVTLGEFACAVCFCCLYLPSHWNMLSKAWIACTPFSAALTCDSKPIMQNSTGSINVLLYLRFMKSCWFVVRQSAEVDINICRYVDDLDIWCLLGLFSNIEHINADQNCNSPTKNSI